MADMSVYPDQHKLNLVELTKSETLLMTIQNVLEGNVFYKQNEDGSVIIYKDKNLTPLLDREAIQSLMVWLRLHINAQVSFSAPEPGTASRFSKKMLRDLGCFLALKWKEYRFEGRPAEYMLVCIGVTDLIYFALLSAENRTIPTILTKVYSEQTLLQDKPQQKQGGGGGFFPKL